MMLVRQVETLAGQVVAVDVDAGATLGAMREGIARQTGIVVRQQRLIILGVCDLLALHGAIHEKSATDDAMWFLSGAS